MSSSTIRDTKLKVNGGILWKEKGKEPSEASKMCRQKHDTLFRGRPLIPLPEEMRSKFFECADGHQYYTREEFGDGSCFFHSLATLLNMHHDSNDSDPTRLQKQVLGNIRHKMQCKLRETGEDILNCFDFVDKKYTSVDPKHDVVEDQIDQ